MTQGKTKNPPVERDHALKLLREMVRIRRLEEKCVELYTAAKIRGFVHLYIGEEAVAVGAMQALVPEDAIVATYRERTRLGKGRIGGVHHGGDVRQS